MGNHDSSLFFLAVHMSRQKKLFQFIELGVEKITKTKSKFPIFHDCKFQIFIEKNKKVWESCLQIFLPIPAIPFPERDFVLARGPIGTLARHLRRLAALGNTTLPQKQFKFFCQVA